LIWRTEKPARRFSFDHGGKLTLKIPGGEPQNLIAAIE
jgi:hypothetical protein